MEAADGWCPGWDLAGVVTHAANGSGPRTGARVVGFLRSGAWAESVVVPTNALAALPDAVTFAQAATLLAGLTALYASPSAVSFCIGACALPGRPAAWAILPSSWRIWPEPRSSRRYAVPIRWPWSSRLALMTWSSGRTPAALPSTPRTIWYWNQLGGCLAAALATLAKDGVCVSLGNSASHEVTCDIRQFRQTGRTTLYGFILFEELAQEPAAVGLAHLAGLIAAGKLKPTISVEAPGRRLARWRASFSTGHLSGKPFCMWQMGTDEEPGRFC